MPTNAPNELTQFSLVAGGPFYRLMTRLSLTTPLRRMIVFSAIAWVPLVILSAVTRAVTARAVDIPVLQDYAAYARFLVGIPLLLLAEFTDIARLAEIVKQFITSNLVQKEEEDNFLDAIRETERLRDLPWVELVLVALAFAGSILGPSRRFSEGGTIWQYTVPNSFAGLTPAGWWYSFVSIPLFQFLLWRWTWRFIIWGRFLWRTSRLPLQLTPTHPDLAGGIGFLSLGQLAFWPLATTGSVVLSGVYLNHMLYMDAQISMFGNQITTYTLLAVLLLFAPLLFFTPKLFITKKRGFLEYGALASGYTQSFNRKWVDGDNPSGESILGTPDLQSLADLGNSFEIVKKMRLVPLSILVFTIMVLLTLAPFALPGVTAISPGEPADLILKIITRVIG